MSMAYHPQTNGKTKVVVHRCLETFLRCFVVDQPKVWVTWLPWDEYWYNTNLHASTGTTMFAIVYGRPPPVLSRFLPSEVRVEAVLRELKDRDEALKQLKNDLLRAYNQLKDQADHRRVERNFEVESGFS